jgi:hypothetical protein
LAARRAARTFARGGRGKPAPVAPGTHRPLATAPPRSEGTV